MKFILMILPMFLSSTAVGNEALNLLERDSVDAGDVYKDAVRSGDLAGRDPVSQKSFVVADPFLPSRWETEMEARFPFEVWEGTQIAPRGLFEYQHHDRSIARGSRLSRARIGVALQSYYGVEILGDALLSSVGDYLGWETLRARVPINDQIRLSVGKFQPPFSTEYSRDAALRWFPTLSPLLAQIAPASSLGAMFEGRGNSLDWKFGWFGGESDRSLPGIDGNGYFLASVSSGSNRGGSESAPDPSFQRWHLDYLYNVDPARSETIAEGYRHLVAAGGQYSSGRFDFYSDFLLARGADHTATGVTAAGGFWILQDAIRLVARYHYATSPDPGGIVSNWGIPSTGSDAIFPSDFPVSTAAGQLSSIYGGLNFHLDDDHFIVGTGVEYRSLSDVVAGDDFSSWGWNTFVRYAF